MSVSSGVTFVESNHASGTVAVQAIAGILAIVLTILGLAHVAPVFMVAIATIAAGAALLAGGTAIAGEYARLSTPGGDLVLAAGGSTWSIGLLAGAAGIVLGILALLDVIPQELVAIAVIAFGGGLILSSGAASQVAMLRAAATATDERARRLAAEAASNSAAAQALTGLASVVLGILALAGFSPLVLILVALLAIGVFLLLSGSAIGGLMQTVFRH